MNKGKKIVLISKKDNASSGYRMAEAINLTTNNFVEYFVLHDTKFPLNSKKRPTLYEDSPWPLPGSFRAPKGWGWKIFSSHNASRVQTILEDADIIHFKGDHLPVDDYIRKVTIPRGKPRVITVSGSFFRRNADPRISLPYAKVDEYIKLTDFRSVITPDLNYPEFDAMYTQQAMDTTALENQWAQPDGKIIFAHSPSQRAKKGTGRFLAAIDILKQHYGNIEVDLLEGLPYDECLKRKARATIFFDQTMAGSYGNSGLEAMAAGIPTTCHISQQAQRQSNGKINKECPVVNCGDTVESMVAAFKKLLNTDLKALSHRTKEWTDNFHSYEAVGAMWDNIYNNL